MSASPTSRITFTLLVLPVAMLLFSDDRLEAQSIDYKALYSQGTDYETFLDEAVSRRQMWLDNTERADIPAEFQRRLAALEGQWTLLVIAIDACSDSANIIPYLAHMATSSDALDLRIIDPKLGKPVMEANRTSDGRTATPTIAVLNDDFEPVGFLVERPPAFQEWALEQKRKMDRDAFMDAKFARYDEERGHESMTTIIEIVER